MKTFRQLFETTEPLKPGPEKKFKDKHVVDVIDPENAGAPKTDTIKKLKRFADREEGGDKAVYESVMKAGQVLKLGDNSTVNVSKQDASLLNNLWSELEGDNKKRMEERLLKDKKSFNEVLAFAKKTTEG